jgi:MFS family permease
VVNTKKGFFAIRYFIGVFEAGVVPGIIYLLSLYYPRYDLQWRVSVMSVGIVLSNAFGGLIAYSIAGIKSGNGYHPWRWIFIIEGCITAVVGILIYFLLAGWPSKAKWLTDAERDVLSEKSK